MLMGGRRMNEQQARNELENALRLGNEEAARSAKKRLTALGLEGAHVQAAQVRAAHAEAEAAKAEEKKADEPSPDDEKGSTVRHAPPVGRSSKQNKESKA